MSAIFVLPYVMFSQVWFIILLCSDRYSGFSVKNPRVADPGLKVVTNLLSCFSHLGATETTTKTTGYFFRTSLYLESSMLHVNVGLAKCCSVLLSSLSAGFYSGLHSIDMGLNLELVTLIVIVTSSFFVFHQYFCFAF